MSNYKLGDYLRTIPEIQAIDLANKGQIADMASYMRKAQHYSNGNIIDSIESSITPAVCENLKLGPTDMAEHTATKVTQFALREVLAQFKETIYYPVVIKDKNKLFKALNLWWAWAGADVIKKVRKDMLDGVTKQSIKDEYHPPPVDKDGNPIPETQFQRYTRLFGTI